MYYAVIVGRRYAAPKRSAGKAVTTKGSDRMARINEEQRGEGSDLRALESLLENVNAGCVQIGDAT